VSIPSPEEFAAGEKGRAGRCFTCVNPLREEIERASANGVGHSTIVRWLRAHHPDHVLGEAALGNHFRAGHAKQP